VSYDDGPGNVSGAQQAVDAIRQLLHDRSMSDDVDMGELYRLVGDLAQLAYVTAQAVGVVTEALSGLHATGRLHHDVTQRPVPTAEFGATVARLERARGALGAAGDVLDHAHNDLSHLYVMDPVLRVVPDPEPDGNDESPVGE